MKRINDNLIKGKEYCNKAEILLNQGEIELELNTLRKALELYLKSVFISCGFPYDERTSTIELMINTLAENNILSEIETKEFHKARKITNAGSHVSMEGNEVTDADGEKAFIIMRKITETIERLVNNGSSIQEKMVENNKPMEYPDYFMSSRPFFQRWAGRNEEKRRTDNTYATLVREARNGDIEPILNLSAGIYEEDGDNTNYYLWIFKAALEAIKKPIEEVPLKYIATVLYEAIVFSPYICFLYEKELLNKVICLNRMAGLVEIFEADLFEYGNACWEIIKKEFENSSIRYSVYIGEYFGTQKIYNHFSRYLPNHEANRYAFSTRQCEIPNMEITESEDSTMISEGQITDYLYLASKEYIDKDLSLGRVGIHFSNDSQFDTIIYDELLLDDSNRFKKQEIEFNYLDEIIYEYGYPAEKIDSTVIKKMVDLLIDLFNKFPGQSIIAGKYQERKTNEEIIDDINFIYESMCVYEKEMNEIIRCNNVVGEKNGALNEGKNFVDSISEGRLSNNLRLRIFNLLDNRIKYTKEISCKIDELRHQIVKDEKERRNVEEKRRQWVAEEKNREERKKKKARYILILIIALVVFIAIIGMNIDAHHKAQFQDTMNEISGKWYRTELFSNEIDDVKFAKNEDYDCFVNGENEGTVSYKKDWIKVDTESFLDELEYNCEDDALISQDCEKFYFRDKGNLEKYKEDRLEEIVKENICCRYTNKFFDSEKGEILKIKQNGSWTFSGKEYNKSGQWNIFWTEDVESNNVLVVQLKDFYKKGGVTPNGGDAHVYFINYYQDIKHSLLEGRRYISIDRLEVFKEVVD